jgi:hypothetical protein
MRHRVVCKVNADPKEDKLASPMPQHNPHDAPLGEDGKELFIDVPAPRAPGGRVKSISALLTPAFMKKARDIMERQHDI